MGHFSNGTEGEMYQARYCFRCVHWTDDAGCPVWFVHEMHVGENAWTAALDLLIPRDEEGFNAQCYTFQRVGRVAETTMTPGQRKGFEDWQRAKRGVGAAKPRRQIESIDL